jgi:hypothetical protein
VSTGLNLVSELSRSSSFSGPPLPTKKGWTHGRSPLAVRAAQTASPDSAD